MLIVKFTYQFIKIYIPILSYKFNSHDKHMLVTWKLWWPIGQLETEFLLSFNTYATWPNTPNNTVCNVLHARNVTYQLLGSYVRVCLFMILGNQKGHSIYLKYPTIMERLYCSCLKPNDNTLNFNGQLYIYLFALIL